MQLIHKTKGFTLVEILVTLVILGLSASLVAPAVVKWLDARTAAAARDELTNILTILPLETEREGRKRVLSIPSDFNLQSEGQLRIIRPLVIRKNGYCEGGLLSLTIRSRTYSFQVSAPNCEVTLAEG